MDASNGFYVYRLRCPVTRLVRYIGVSCEPAARLKQHRTEKFTKKKTTWVQWLKSQHLQPVLEVIAGPTTRTAALQCELLLTFFMQRFYPGQLVNTTGTKIVRRQTCCLSFGYSAPEYVAPKSKGLRFTWSYDDDSEESDESAALASEAAT